MRSLILMALLLSGCAHAPSIQAEQARAEAAARPLPAPVWPDECVADWYAKTHLPPCVESWITDITKQQKTIEKKRRKRWLKLQPLQHAKS